MQQTTNHKGTRISYEQALEEFENKRKNELESAWKKENIILKNEKRVELLYKTVSIIVGILLGVAVGTILTLINKKTESGQYLKDSQCIRIDKECAYYCNPGQFEDCSECCLEWGEKLTPLSAALSGNIRFFGFIGIIPGLYLSSVLVEEKIMKKRRERQSEYPFERGGIIWDEKTGKIVRF